MNRHRKLMEDAGFEKVNEKILKIPMGPWPKGKTHKEMVSIAVAHSKTKC